MSAMSDAEHEMLFNRLIQQDSDIAKGLSVLFFEVKAIKTSMWTPESLDNRIQAVHEESCQRCPVRVRFEHERIADEVARSKNKDKEDGGKRRWDVMLKVGLGALAVIFMLVQIVANLTGTKVQVMPDLSVPQQSVDR